MLGVDGYTVKWGADTTDFDRASDKVRKRVRADSEFFSDEWEKAQIKFRNRVFGISNAGVAAMGGVAASIAIATTALKKWSEVDPSGQTQKSFADVGKEIKNIWYEIGVNVEGVMGFIKTGLGWARDFVNYWNDVWQGDGPRIGDVLEERKRQQAQIDARKKFGEDASSSLKSFGGANELKELERVAAAEAKMATMAYGKTIAELEERYAGPDEFEQASWIYQGKMAKILEPAMKARAEVQKAFDETQKFSAEANEAFNKKFAGQLEYIDRVEKSREYISMNVRLAEIEDMRARGLERQADAAKIRLDTEKEIRQILEQEGVGIDEQLSAIDAIRGFADRRIAALKDPKKRQADDISTFLAPGMIGASRELAPQVMGRAGATYDKTISLQEQQLNVLQDIARNTSQTPVGVLGP